MPIRNLILNLLSSTYLNMYAFLNMHAFFYLKVFEISNLEWCVKNHVDHPQVTFLDNAGQQEFI